MTKCYKVKIEGLGYAKNRNTESRDYGKTKKYPTKKSAMSRVELEKSRGWKAKIVRCKK